MINAFIRQPTILAVASGKGGVGKSTIAALLARGWRSKGKKVGLLDLDVHGPSLPTLFDLYNQAPEQSADGRLLPIRKAGLALMSFAFILGGQPAIIRGGMIGRLVAQVLTQVDWGDTELLVIDLPPGTGDVPLSLTQTVPVDGAVIVTTNHDLAFADVEKAIIMFENVAVPVLGFIENMAYFTCSNCSTRHYPFGRSITERLQHRFGLDCLAKLPLRQDIDPGRMIVSEEPAVFEACEKIETMLLKRSAAEEKRPSITIGENSLNIAFPDGLHGAMTFNELRYYCRCALCEDELTGQRRIRLETIAQTLTVEKIDPIGNYAVKIAFSDGHKSGIYPYPYLRELLLTRISLGSGSAVERSGCRCP